MATIAREQRVPALVNTEEATRLLRNDDEITLDATQNIVYRGRVAELDRFERSESDMTKITVLTRTLFNFHNSLLSSLLHYIILYCLI